MDSIQGKRSPKSSSRYTYVHVAAGPFDSRFSRVQLRRRFISCYRMVSSAGSRRSVTPDGHRQFVPPNSTFTALNENASHDSRVMSRNEPMPSVTSNKPELKGVVFDMDGTLIKPKIDFAKMYDECNVPRGADILDVISKMSPEDAARASAIVSGMEDEAMESLELMPGAVDLGRWLQNHGIPTGLVTRNTTRTVDLLVQEWSAKGGPEFELVLSRDNSLVNVATQWRVDLSCDGESVVMVGDSPKNDVAFGRAAGAATALLDVDNTYCKDAGTDEGALFKVEGLWQLPSLLWQYHVIPGGLGTGQPLKAYDGPQPSGKACLAAFAGATTILKSCSPKECNTPDATGNTPLIWAAEAGKIDAVRHLLSIPDVAVNHRGYIGATAICRASRRGHADVVRLLALEGGADMNIPNVKMQYPLHFAAFKRMHEAVDALLECGASTFTLDRKGRTAAEDTNDDCIREKILSARKAILSNRD